MPPDANAQGTGTQQQAQATQTQEPKWLSAIADSALKEEAKKGWMLNEDYTRKTQSLSEQQRGWETEKAQLQDRAKQYDAMQQWYQSQYLPFHGRIESKWKEIDAYLNGQYDLVPKNGQQAQTSQQSPDVFRDWDLLPAPEQAKRMSEHLRTTYFDPQLQQRDQQWQQFYADKEKAWAGFIQRYNAIYADAFQKALTEYRQGKDFPIQDYVNAQLEISAGKIDVPGLAYQKIVGDSRQKELEQQWYERGKKDRDQELLNQQQTPGALQNTSVPVFRQPPKTPAEVTAAARKIAAEKGIPWT